MSIRVRRIPAADLSSSLCNNWVDTGKRPYIEGTTAFVPVKENYPATDLLPARKPYRGRGYHMIGPVAVVRGEKPSPDEIRNLVSWQKPKGVLWIKSLSGAERAPVTELLYGTAGDVIHREQRFSYLLDPSLVMFSQGNRLEKIRMGKKARRGERIADMYAGIGYFTIPMACSEAFVHALEINPVAFRYMVTNTRLNHVESRVIPECGDCRSLLSGEYDRIVMGHFDALSALPDALIHVHTGTELHVHSTGTVPPEISGIIEKAGYNPIIDVRQVKKTGPGRWHYVQDVVLR